MICDSCKTDRLNNDFINNTNICYKCVLRKKLEKTQENRTLLEFVCRTCSKEIIRKENLKKRQRSVFCSSECALKGHKELTSNHWTRKIRSGRVV